MSCCARALPQRPGQRLDVVLGRLAAGQPAADQRCSSTTIGPNARVKSEQQLEARPRRRRSPRPRGRATRAARRRRGRPRSQTRVQRRALERRVQRPARSAAAPGSRAARARRTAPAGGRRPGGVAELVAGQHVEQPGGVGDRAGEHAVADQEALAGVGTDRDPAARGLQPDQTAAGGRDPDRSAAVVAVGDRHHPGGDRRRRAAAGAARRAVETSHGLRGRAEAPRLGRGQDPHLRQRRSCRRSRSRRRAAGARGTRRAGDEPAEQVAAHRQRHPRDGAVVLDRDRHPGERARVAGLDRRPAAASADSRGDVGERVDRGLELVDPAQRCRRPARSRSSPRLAPAPRARRRVGAAARSLRKA